MSDIANNELFSSWPFSISNQEAPAEFSLAESLYFPDGRQFRSIVRGEPCRGT